MTARPMPAMAFEALRYGAVSILALLVDAGLLWSLTAGHVVPYLAAATVSYVAGGVVAYLLSIRYVFRHRRIPRTSIELPAFVLLGLVGLLVNFLVIATAVELFETSLPVAKGMAATCTFTVNFLVRRQSLFTGHVPLATGSGVK